MTSGTERCWDNEECPRDGCGGELQQQDKCNVMCLSCEGICSHVKTETTHYLQTADFETVAEKSIAMADGGANTSDVDRSAVDEEYIEELKQQEPDPPDPEKGLTVRRSGYQTAKAVKRNDETWNDLLKHLVQESGRSADTSGTKLQPIAWICEVGRGDWNDFISRQHPNEVFDHVPYRDVRPLVKARSVGSGAEDGDSA